jgi:gliding motility-associated-like protein
MFKKILFILIVFVQIQYNFIAQNCPNSNFSQGNFTNWTGTTGTTPAYTGTPYDVPGFVAGQHTIITSSSPDPNTGGAIPTIPPGAASSCMLGNAVPGYGAESMTYTMTVDATNRLFIYEYAMVLQDPISPPHAVNEKPRFIVKLMDMNGQVLPGNCSYYETYGGDPNNNFTYYTNVVTYSDWKKVAIDLSDYTGMDVKIQFTTMDCGLGAHWGYAYLTTSCGPMEIDIQKNCEGAIVLTAPPGFHSYLWSPGGETTQSITLNNPPTATYTYSCEMNPIAGLSCITTLDTTFNFIATPAFSVVDTAICLGESVVLSTSNDEVGGTYIWSPTGQTTSSITVSPTSNTTYYVTYNALNNCTYTDTSVVIVNPLPAFFLEDFYVCDGNQAELDPEPDIYDYTWNNGYQSNVPFTPTTPQYYIVTATDPVTGCQQTDSLFIDIKPLPTAAFSSVCGSLPAEFTNESVGGAINFWNFGDGSPIVTGNMVIHPYLDLSNDSYIVTLTTESIYGCRDSIQQEFLIPLMYYVPNTFTPDGDEFNNEFKPIFSQNKKVGTYKFIIYNRWGEVVFETRNIEVGWDGTYDYKRTQDGTFTWELQYSDLICNKGLQHIYGHVNLVK